jgi:hypothetical protein
MYGERNVAKRVLVGNPRGICHLEYIRVDGRTLKWNV